MEDSTKTGVAANESSLDDSVMRLREWGTDTIYVLPQLPSLDLAGLSTGSSEACSLPLSISPVEFTIGSADICSITLHDPTGHASRLHAALVFDRANKWLLQDLGSKNGIKLDGAHRSSNIALQPGDEIGIGGITLIAESQRSIALRAFLSRLLGWRSERIQVVDHALRSIRMAATRRAVLVLRGDGDLVPIARAIHRRAFGADRPFIVCDPRRRQSKATVRSAENYETGMPALAAATGGSLCVRNRRLSQDFKRVIAALHAPNSPVRLVLCAQTSEDYDSYLAIPITVPPLASRPDEIDQIITEYAEDAITQLSTSHTGFLPADRDWVRMHSALSLPDIEKATLRLVAIRESRNLSNAAARLGMAPISLRRWIGRRKLPMHVDP